MNDIDFEELDRAVSSALGPDAGKTPAATAEAPAPATPAPAPTPPPVPTPTPASPSPAARRSSGRFMDVVHPSSDMRSGGGSTQSRPLEVPPRPASTPVPDEGTQETPSTQGSSFQWPDPLDMAESPKTESGSEPQGSPFMNTEKIEKRPLGAFSSEKAPEEPKPESESASEAPAETSQPIAEAGAVDVSALDMSEEALVGGTKQADTEPEASSVPTEITQQYKEQPSTTEQPSGAIYDTESYHKPLAHPAKKQSSVLVIVWIIGLILLGGGLGAAMYFFVLPLL